MGVNKVILLGNLGKDPEMRYASNQTAICRFSLATGERRKDQSGNWVDHTEWHNVVTFGKTAENCSQFLKKGKQAYIEGRIQTNKWKDKEGKDRYTTEIIASTVQFIGGARDAGGAPRGRSEDYVEVSGSPEEASAGQELVASLASADNLGGGSGKPSGETFDDDDIPF